MFLPMLDRDVKVKGHGHQDLYNPKSGRTPALIWSGTRLTRALDRASQMANTGEPADPGPRTLDEEWIPERSPSAQMKRNQHIFDFYFLNFQLRGATALYYLFKNHTF